MSALITNRPAAWALSTRPHPAGPIVCRAVTGPSTDQIPAWRQLASVTDTEPIQIHLIRRNVAQPARMSLSRLDDPGGGAASVPSWVAHSAATRKVTASKATAHP